MSGCCVYWLQCLSVRCECHRSRAVSMFGLARITYSSATHQSRLHLLVLSSSSSVKTSKADTNTDTLGGTSFMNIWHHISELARVRTQMYLGLYITYKQCLASCFCFQCICCSSRSSVLYLAWCFTFCCFLLTEIMHFFSFAVSFPHLFLNC